jgi:hypothetical protein
MSYDYHGREQVFSTLLVIFLVYLGAIILVSLVYYVLNGFAFMKLYRKVGIEPWAAWVPYFNTWRQLELGGESGWLSVLQLISFGRTVAAVFECIGAYKTGLAFRKDGSWVVLFIFLPFVWAWQLAADGVVYEPDLIRQRGYKPPLAGFGSARGPYVPPTQAPPAA